MEITHGRAEDCYAKWPNPDIIFSDGPYGLRMYKEDRANGQEMADWYRPHVDAWAARSSPHTVLLFCGREISWANVHRLLEDTGWVYRQIITWDKGKGHIAGRVNSKSATTWPIVTEIVAFYARPPIQGVPSMREAQLYMRDEWLRTGLPLSRANEACGVKNAATRKYLTLCHLWYPPPPDVFARLAAYANEHGGPAGRPYFAQAESLLRDGWYGFELPFGQTNVFRIPHPPKPRHPNEKPGELVRKLLAPFAQKGHVLWEPFGGTCAASRVADTLGMDAYAAEVDAGHYRTAMDAAGLPAGTS